MVEAMLDGVEVRLNTENYQGNAVVNYTEYEIPYTRVIEHKHFEFSCLGGKATVPQVCRLGGKMSECNLRRPPWKIPSL